MEGDGAMTPEDAVVKALEDSPRPLSFTELTHPVRRATGEWATVPRMMGVLSKLVARRLITRRPLVNQSDFSESKWSKGPSMDVSLCDFHPAGRDPWITEALCDRCGQYAASDTGCTRCAADDAEYAERGKS
jgi:hypothetical protein